MPSHRSPRRSQDISARPKRRSLFPRALGALAALLLIASLTTLTQPDLAPAGLAKFWSQDNVISSEEKRRWVAKVRAWRAEQARRTASEDHAHRRAATEAKQPTPPAETAPTPVATDASDEDSSAAAASPTDTDAVVGDTSTTGATDAGAPATPDGSTSQVTTSGGALSWSPPAGWTGFPVHKVTATNALNVVDAKGGDVIIELPKSHSVAPIAINNCRNAVLIGGSITVLPSAKVSGADQRAIYVKGCTGTVHIEGVHIRGDVAGSQSDGIAVSAPQAVVQIQNVRVDGLRGGQGGNHADVFQPWGGVREFRIDRLTGSTNYQGLHIFETRGSIGRGIIRDTNIAGTDTGGTDGGGYYIWMDCEDTYPLSLEDVYVKPRPGRPFTQSVWPSATHKECPGVFSSGMVTWPQHRSVAGGVREGAPAGGDFVPAAAVGLSYASPGYR